jgi:predicted nucleic acid-binding protein
MACLDTSVLLDLLGRGGRRRRRQAVTLLRQLTQRGEHLTTTRFTQAELQVGVERSRTADRERRVVQAALADLEILDFDEPAALAFGKLSAHLQQRGTPAGDMDVLIAAVSLVNGQRLVTANARHFSAIPGLVVEGY